jgi:glc operon protein GlcG
VAIALNKAHCSAIRRQPTGPVMQDGVENLRNSLALAIGSEAAQTPLRGGLPVVADGHVVGAIGVSNGNEDQDTDVARAGVDAFAAACAAGAKG